MAKFCAIDKQLNYTNRVENKCYLHAFENVKIVLEMYCGFGDKRSTPSTMHRPTVISHVNTLHRPTAGLFFFFFSKFCLGHLTDCS